MYAEEGILETGRGSYSLGSSVGAESRKCWPEASATRIRARRGGSSTTSRRVGGGAALLQEPHLALDRALRRPLVLVEHWADGRVIIQYGGGAGHPHPNPARSQREKGDRCVFTCRSARPNQNTTWSKTVSPLKSILPWWVCSGVDEKTDGLNIPCPRPSLAKPIYTHLFMPFLLA